MREKITGLTCFALGMGVTLLVSCGTGPKVSVYVSDPQRGGMEYYNEKNGAQGFVDYKETEKFVCFTPNDVQQLLNYCRVKK